MVQRSRRKAAASAARFLLASLRRKKLRTFFTVASIVIAFLLFGLAESMRHAFAAGAAGVALSFGPALPGYAALYHWLPLLQGVRGAARFGFLGLVAVVDPGVGTLRRDGAEVRVNPRSMDVLTHLALRDGQRGPRLTGKVLRPTP